METSCVTQERDCVLEEINYKVRLSFRKIELRKMNSGTGCERIMNPFPEKKAAFSQRVMKMVAGREGLREPRACCFHL